MAQKALSFDGLDDKVVVTDSPSLSAISPFSVEAWIKIASLGGNEGIVSKDWAGSNREWVFFGKGADDQLGLSLFSSNSANFLVAFGTTDIADGGWHYVVATWDGVNATGHIKLWVDGSEETLTRDEKNSTGYVPHDTATPIEIGRYLNSNTYCWSGLIDEVRISNKVRSQAEIEAIWNNGNGVQFEVDADTVALWHINEDNGTIFDETANNNDGTIFGASWVAGYPFVILQAVGSGAIAIAGALSTILTIFQNVGAGSIAISGSLTTVKRFIQAVGAGSIAIAGILGRLTKISVGAGSIAISGALSSILTIILHLFKVKWE